MAWKTGWDHRKKITLKSSLVVETVTDFPVLIKRASDADISAAAQADGDDICFTQSDGTTQLKHEIQRYTTASGYLVAWVKIPSLSSTVDTDIYCYYGNSGAADQQDVPNVWTNGFLAVWHMSENSVDLTASFYKDSTSNARHATLGSSSGITAVDALFDKGLASGSGHAAGSVLDSGDWSHAGNQNTLSYWCRPEILPDGDWRMMSKADGGAAGDIDYLWGARSSDVVRARWRINGTTDTWEDAGAFIRDSEWQYQCLTANQEAIELYQGRVITPTPSWENNESLTHSQTGQPSEANTGRNHTIMGDGLSAGNSFQGIMCEARIASVARTSGWLETEFNNQRDPEGFIVVGAEEDAPAGGISPSSIASLEAFGTAKLGLFVTPTSIASAEGFGSPALSARIVASGLATAEAFGAPTVAPGAVALLLTGIASLEAFGTAAIGLRIAPSGIATLEAFGSPTLAPGAVSIAPGGIGTAEAFGSPVVGLGTIVLLPSSIASGEAFGSPSVAPGGVNLAPGGIASLEAFGTPIVGAGLVVQVPSIASLEAFGAPSVAPGAVTLAPAGIATLEAFGSPLLGLYVAPASIGSGEAHGTPTLAVGPVSLLPAGIASLETFGALTVGRGAVDVAPGSIASLEGFGSPTLAIGAITLRPTGIGTGEAFGAPLVGLVQQFVVPASIVSAEAFGSHSLAVQLQFRGVITTSVVVANRITTTVNPLKPITVK